MASAGTRKDGQLTAPAPHEGPTRSGGNDGQNRTATKTTTARAPISFARPEGEAKKGSCVAVKGDRLSVNPAPAATDAPVDFMHRKSKSVSVSIDL